jgi:hypothetical protein
MHFIRGSIRADTLCANAQGSGTQHFSDVHSSVERLASVPRTRLYPPLLVRIHSQSHLIPVISTRRFVAVGVEVKNK